MKLKKFEKILVAIYVLAQKKKRVTYRKLTAYLYITDYVLNVREFLISDLLPNGPESQHVNAVLEILSSNHYIKAINGFLNITQKGLKTVENIISNPDKQQSRIFYRIVSKLAELDYEKILELITYIHIRESGIEYQKISPDIVSIYDELLGIVKKYKPEEIRMGEKIIQET